MNNDTPPLAVASPEIHLAPEARFSALAQVWRVFSHPLLLVVLMALGAAAMALHLWLPQIPTALAADPAAGSAWLNEAAARTPGGALFRALGAFNLAHNLALKLLLGFLAATLFIRITNGVLRIRATRRLVPPDAWLPGLQVWDASIGVDSVEDGWMRACAVLCPSARMNVETREDGEMQRICDCHHRVQWLSILTEIGLLLALLALLLNLFSGWQMDGLTLIPGDRISLSPYSDFTVGLSGDASLLTICCPEKQASLDAGGLHLGAVRVQITDRERALRIRLNRGDEPLKLQAIEQGAYTANDLVVHFPETNSERAIAAPEANLFFRLVALADGGFRVQALDANNQVLFSQEIHADTALPVGDDLTLNLHPTAFIIARAWERPWTWLLAPAMLLVAAGLFAGRRYPYWRVGVRSDGRSAALRWQGLAFTHAHFRQFIAQLSTISESTDEETFS